MSRSKATDVEVSVCLCSLNASCFVDIFLRTFLRFLVHVKCDAEVSDRIEKCLSCFAASFLKSSSVSGLRKGKSSP